MPSNDNRDPKMSGAPPRDTRDNPAPNPDGCTEGQPPLTPKPLRDPSPKRGSDARRQTDVTSRPGDIADGRGNKTR
jgi:hypothetical protein